MAAENLNSFALQCFDYGLRRDAHQLLAWGQCFVKGVYASQYIEAAMVGYDQSGDAIYWEKELRRRFDSDLHNDLCIKQILQKAQVLSSLPDVWTSEHEREENAPIVIYHIFLDCSAAPA